MRLGCVFVSTRKRKGEADARCRRYVGRSQLLPLRILYVKTRCVPFAKLTTRSWTHANAFLPTRRTAVARRETSTAPQIRTRSSRCSTNRCALSFLPLPIANSSSQLLIEQQDRTLTDISGTVDLLREQAKVMGREVLDQNVYVLSLPSLKCAYASRRMLEEMDGHVDGTSNRLAKAQRRMQGFIRENQSMFAPLPSSPTS